MNHKPQKNIKDLFGFDFPEDFFQFYDWLQNNKQINLQDDLEIALLDIFDIFKNDFNENNLFDFIQKFRFYNDPPEFIGLFRGFTDGLHWGYYFDSPEEISPIVTFYYHSDSYELENAGNTIFESLRCLIETNEEVYEDFLETETDPNMQEVYHRDMNIYKEIRPLLLPFTSDRSEIGSVYIEKYQSVNSRNHLIIAPTYHRFGIIAPLDTYKHIDDMQYDLTHKQIENYIDLAYQCLKEGFPATSLQIAHNFWVGKKTYREQVNDLFKKSYELLNRKSLIPLLEVAIASRIAFDKENETE
ncbi:MAG: DUF2228 domain-containing protein [Leptospiraceae bacterium]|nr:DUF2228 domain-containing protein [Leptospiraceae bacterium]